jgi:hypothetical protein
MTLLLTQTVTQRLAANTGRRRKRRRERAISLAWKQVGKTKKTKRSARARTLCPIFHPQLSHQTKLH